MKLRLRNRWIKDGTTWVIPEHRWFAWYPVRVGDYLVWLERVLRIGHDGDGYGDSWTYRINE